MKDKGGHINWTSKCQAATSSCYRYPALPSGSSAPGSWIPHHSSNKRSDESSRNVTPTGFLLLPALTTDASGIFTLSYSAQLLETWNSCGFPRRKDNFVQMETDNWGLREHPGHCVLRTWGGWRKNEISSLKAGLLPPWHNLKMPGGTCTELSPDSLLNALGGACTNMENGALKAFLLGFEMASLCYPKEL